MHQLSLADRLIVNLFDLFRDNILREPNATTVKELYNGLQAKPQKNHQVGSVLLQQTVRVSLTQLVLKNSVEG